MTTYISTNGTVQPLTMAIIREIERTIITDLERKRYENLSEHYKSRYSLKSWINTQVIGRIFMSGNKSNESYSEFYRTYYPMAFAAARVIVKDEDTAANVVANQFNIFFTRRMYNNNKTISIQQEKIEKLKKNRKDIINELTIETYNPEKDYQTMYEVELPQIERQIEEEEAKLQEMIMQDEKNNEEYLAILDGKSYREIYSILKKDLNSKGKWIKEDMPISGYIIRSVRNLAIQMYNQIKNEKVIIASRLQKANSQKDELMTEDELFDVAESNHSSSKEEYAFDSTFESSVIDLSSEENADNELSQLMMFSDELTINRAKELCLLSEENAGILIDFIFNGMNQEDIRKKYNLRTVGAIKSRVSRTRMKIREQIMKEKQTQAILERKVESGTIVNYFPDCICKIKETLEIQHGEKHGQYKAFYKDGSVRKATTYKNNRLNGEYKEYYENGYIKVSGQYKDGKKVGEWKYGTELRSLDKVENYNEDGSVLVEYYNHNGIVTRVKHIDKNGFETTEYKNCDYTVYYSNSEQLKVSGQYKGGKKFGLWKHYDKDGSLADEIEYGENEEILSCKIYDKEE